MALLNPTQAKLPGVTITPVALNAGGDTIKPDERVALLIINKNATTARNVTVVDPRSTEFGQAHGDPQKSIAALAAAVFGPFPARLVDPADSLIDITYDTVADLDAYLIRV